MFKTPLSCSLSRAVAGAGLALSLGLAPPAVWAQAHAQPALALFMQAAGGDTAAAPAAAKAFADWLKAEPGHPVLLAYAGSATSMQANTTWAPWKKLAYAEDGLGQIDKALALLTPAHDAPWVQGVPAVLEVKFVAANTFLAVPGFMNRKERGQRLLREVLDSPLWAGAPAVFRTSVQAAADKAGLAGARP
ncbi:MAG: hypothetical protein Q8Q84_21275 [Hydrogenophaga sp.]|nr:hypothetical protein [Hydrogenophaga sp.]